jgi:hypothetical protein
VPPLRAHPRRSAALIGASIVLTAVLAPAAVAERGRNQKPKHGVPAVAFAGISEGQAVPRRATFRVRLANFSICPTLTPSRLVAGQGFLHFSMDGGALDVPGVSANGAWAVRAGTQGRYSPAQSSSLTYANLPRGPHSLRVSLSDNFQAETGVAATVTFVVR